MRTQFLVPLLVGALALGACGGDDDSEADATDTNVSTTSVPSTDVPERIVSLSPSATEMLFAIGAGDQVEAVDEQSDYPEGVPTTDLSGYEPNVEAIAGYDPDLVVMDSPAIADELERLDIALFVAAAPTTLDEAYEQFEQLGEATGHTDEAADVVAQMKSDIDKIVADVPPSDTTLTIYHELDDLYYSATSSTFIGALYEMVGFDNIAEAADTDGTGYPQLSAEYIIDANPDIVFLADGECCGESAETVGARPGWNVLAAVQAGNIVQLDDDVASRWGPRVVDLFETIVAAHHQAQS